MISPYRTLSTPVTQGYVSWGSLPNNVHLHCVDAAARRGPSHAALEKTDRVKFDISITIGRSSVERNKFVLQHRPANPASPRLYSSFGIAGSVYKCPRDGGFRGFATCKLDKNAARASPRITVRAVTASLCCACQTCSRIFPLSALKERGILGSRGYRSSYLSGCRLSTSQTFPAHPNQQSSSFKRPDHDDIPRTFAHFDSSTGAHFLPIMDTSPEPEDLWIRSWTEESLRRRFALTIRGLTTDWRGDLGGMLPHYNINPVRLLMCLDRVDCLAKLPPELFSIVLDQLFCHYDNIDEEHKDIKSGLSRTSLVCQAWCRIQRPKLFASIWLHSTTDVRFLLDMLRRPNNGWLPAAVTEIHIVNHDSPGISTERCCRLLLPKFPSLAVLDYDRIGDPFNRQFGPSLQPVFVRHKNIRKLTLDSSPFQSLSVLVHVLGDMANLEVLEVSNCPEHISSSDRAPTRMFLSSFPKLRRVCHETEGDRSGKLGWLLSPLLARRCKDHPEDAASGNSDAALLILLGDLLCDDNSYRSTAMTYVEGIVLQFCTGGEILNRRAHLRNRYHNTL